MKFARPAFLIFSITCLVSVVAAPVVSHTPTYADMQTCPPIQPQNVARAIHQKIPSFAFLIDANGEVVQSKLTKSSGDKDFDKDALQAFQKCTFHPATFHGKSEMSWVMLSHK
jgi:TonB family protein